MGLMRNIMMAHPAIPSTQVCQVKYWKVGLWGEHSRGVTAEEGTAQGRIFQHFKGDLHTPSTQEEMCRPQQQHLFGLLPSLVTGIPHCESITC